VIVKPVCLKTDKLVKHVPSDVLPVLKIKKIVIPVMKTETKPQLVHVETICTNQVKYVKHVMLLVVTVVIKTLVSLVKETEF